MSTPILYAEDDPNDAILMRHAFARAGIQNPLHVVTTGGKAIEYLAGRGDYSNRNEFPLPCFLLLDLNLPEKDGMEVLKWVRATPSTTTLPVVVLTSSDQAKDIRRAYTQGTNGYLIKPTDPNELVTMVKAFRDYWLVQNRAIFDCVKLEPA